MENIDYIITGYINIFLHHAQLNNTKYGDMITHTVNKKQKYKNEYT